MSFSSVHTLKIFYGIDTSVIDSIVEKCSRKTFPQGEIILQEGDESDGKCYVIISGQVEVLQNGSPIAKLESGDIFGEMALMSDEARSATVCTLSDIQAIEMSQEEIFTIIENDENNLNKEIMRRMEENLERE